MNNTCNRICLYNTCQNRVSSYTLTNPPPGCATHWFHSFMQFFFSVHETNGFLERVSTAMTINRYQKQLPTVELLCSLIQATHIYDVSNGALLIVSKETQLNSEYYPHIFTWYIVCHCIELKFEKIFIFRDNHPCQPPLITFLHPFWVGGFFFLSGNRLTPTYPFRCWSRQNERCFQGFWPQWLFMVQMVSKIDTTLHHYGRAGRFWNSDVVLNLRVSVWHNK